MLGNFSNKKCLLLIFFKINVFKKKMSYISLEWPTVWIQTRPHRLWGLVRTVCKRYKQMALGGNELHKVFTALDKTLLSTKKVKFFLFSNENICCDALLRHLLETLQRRTKILSLG